MKFLISILLMTALTENLYSRNKDLGPHTVSYAAFQENITPKYQIVKDEITVIAENTVDGTQYVAEGVNPRVEVPPGFYRFRGSSRNCKFKDRFTYITKSRNLALKAVCI